MIVVDASVVVKALTEEPGSAAAIKALAASPDRAAPDLLALEVAAALSKKVRMAGLPLDQAEAALASLDAFVTETYTTQALTSRAIVLSLELRHAFYDCLYLALAEALGCPVLTADMRFADHAEQAGYGSLVQRLTGA